MYVGYCEWRWTDRHNDRTDGQTDGLTDAVKEKATHRLVDEEKESDEVNLSHS